MNCETPWLPVTWGESSTRIDRNPWHGQLLSQGVVAGWVGLNQTQLSRIETGAPSQDLAKLIQWARVLRIPDRLLWFSLPGGSAGNRDSAPSGQPAAAAELARPVDGVSCCVSSP
jgi:transcriptional regulator with XRE-family HTH domain